jgi:hypothetical protein
MDQGSMPRIPEEVLRRFNRVRQRQRDDDSAEDLMDDFRNLIRAFEPLMPPCAPDRQAASFSDAVASAIAMRGLDKCGGIIKLVKRAQHFERAPRDVLLHWFGGPGANEVTVREALADWSRLRDAAEAPHRWHKGDSKRLGRLLYAMRNAIVHAGVQTDDGLVPRILTAARVAMCELIVGRAAFIAGITLAEAESHFYE